jgi:glycine cleavage system H protein
LVRVDVFDFPDALFYTNRHLWARSEPSNVLTLGVDALGQTLAGKIVFVRLLRKGAQLSLGQGFGTMESLKWVERLSSPVGGVLEETNEALRSHPDLVNKDSYGEGWLVKIRVEGNPEEQLTSLTHGVGIETWAKQELVKYSEQLKKKRE